MQNIAVTASGPALCSTSTKSKLKRVDKLTRRLYCAYWCLFLGFLGCGIIMPPAIGDAPGTSYQILNYSTLLCLCVMIYLSAKHYFTVMRKLIETPAGIGYSCFLMILIVLELVNGVVCNEGGVENIRMMILEFLPMMALVTIFPVATSKNLQYLFINALPVQSLLAGLVGFSIVMRLPIEYGRLNVDSPHFFAMNLSSIAIMACAGLHVYNLRQKLFAIAGLLLYFFVLISYQSRGGSLNAFVIFPIALCLVQRKAKRINTRSILLVVLSVLVIAPLTFIVAIQSSFVRENLEIGRSGTIDRLLGGQYETSLTRGLESSFETEITDVRGAEAEEFVSRSSGFTWLFGHGWGGGWYPSWSIASGLFWRMVHFGPLHLVLKGGIALSLIFMALFAFAMINAWKAAPYEPYAPAAFCFLLFYFVDFIKHGPVLNAYYFYCVWFALGIALSFRVPRMRREQAANR
ncbi:MAG: hypothetical protein WAW37_14505 [Syntrophobacteraceae bacterium]